MKRFWNEGVSLEYSSSFWIYAWNSLCKKSNASLNVVWGPVQQLPVEYFPSKGNGTGFLHCWENKNHWNVMCVFVHVGALVLGCSSWKYNAVYRLLSLDYASCPITEMTYLLIWQKHIAVGFTVILELLPVTGSRVLNYISLCTGCMDDDVFS